MNSTFARAAACAALLAAAGCRSAFAPEPVLKLSSAPAAEHPATVVQAAELRSGPDGLAKVLGTVAAGTTVTASDKPIRGFLRVRTADGKSGYVPQAAVSATAAASAPAPAPAGAVAP
ncbi:SH3 domain-containing protein [Anaeromyxobacter dehalogenans]|uniref:SH3b domain-containing protein n=1 Tax=Anaeromyxobacter dehalogenans (strain 2CP-C) TaxID=290397 RepID=Q2IM66_ANADE|nr:SH3 domain-containing protein [Anaeromyxobacter dehalogenans]ABC79901.1 hypothetical protein Adeh_0124 [Anaeromyxobacter dehalogenans 2CP-C]